MHRMQSNKKHKAIQNKKKTTDVLLYFLFTLALLLSFIKRDLFVVRQSNAYKII